VWKNRFGYATTAVLAAGGDLPLGGSGTINWWDVDHCTSADPERFLAYLETCLQRHERLQATRALPDENRRESVLRVLESEIVDALQEAHTSRKPGRTGTRKP